MLWFMDPPLLPLPLTYTPTFLSASPLLQVCQMHFHELREVHILIRLGFICVIDDQDSLKLQLKETALEFSWPITRIRASFPQLSSTPTSCSVENAKAIAALVQDLNIPEANFGLASGVSAFLWLYSSIQGSQISIHFFFYFRIQILFSLCVLFMYSVWLFV